MGRRNRLESDGGEHFQGRPARGREVGGPITLRRPALTEGEFSQPAGEAVTVRRGRGAEGVGKFYHELEQIVSARVIGAKY